MRILWFTWKDRKNPSAGGAEVINEGLAKKLAENGHTVKLLVGGYPGCVEKEMVDGYEIIRLGNRFTVYFKAYLYYKKNLIGWADRIIEEVNTLPFMTQWYVKEKKRFLLIYQLCRTIWFHEIGFPFNIVGFLLEPIYLYLLRNNTVLTESKSTQTDLLHFGFSREKIHIFPVFLENHWLHKHSLSRTKKTFNVLSFGSIRSMKRTHHQLKAFELVKAKLPSLTLTIAGSAQTTYGKKVLKMIANSSYATDIHYLGPVLESEKIDLMQHADIILVSSVKEGWGMIVTEAGSVGTPAIVYDVEGLRDSVLHNKTGLVVKSNPQAMAEAIINLYSNPKLYAIMRSDTAKHSQTFNLDRSYATVRKTLKV